MNLETIPDKELETRIKEIKISFLEGDEFRLSKLLKKEFLRFDDLNQVEVDKEIQKIEADKKHLSKSLQEMYYSITSDQLKKLLKRCNHAKLRRQIIQKIIGYTTIIGLSKTLIDDVVKDNPELLI